jgi:hypothetical protein
VSTAFDKMMRTRGDHLVRTEPFSIAYYLGPEQRSPRFAVTHPEASFERVLDQVLRQADGGPVFVKEMPYQLGPPLSPEVVAAFRGTFLIRDPAHALPSLARHWSDFTDDEAGYAAQHAAWTMMRELGEEPVVIDSDDLRADPEAVVGAWCDAVGIQRRPDALRWTPGMPDEWRVWESWMTRAAESTGFAPPDRVDPPPVDAVMAERIAASRPYYAALAEHRLTA